MKTHYIAKAHLIFTLCDRDLDTYYNVGILNQENAVLNDSQRMCIEESCTGCSACTHTVLFGCHNTVIQMFFVAWNIKHNMNINGLLQKPA